MTTEYKQQVSTARTTGVWYLILAISGVFGFLIVHPQIFVANDPGLTLNNFVNHEALARTRLILEFLIIISQALTAAWFYKLFKTIDDWAAWSIGLWGMVNATIILLSAVSIASAINISNSSMDIANQIVMIELLSSLGTNAWGAGSIFFALWLFPMGYVITKSKRMPLWLGRILIIGGVGYLLSTVLGYSGVDSSFVELLTIPATIGEFWMIGYLLVYGIRPAIEERL